MARPFRNALQPAMIYRLFGYGGLALLAVTQIRDGSGPASVCLLGFALCWPLLWWRLSAGAPAFRHARAAGAAIAHSAECLLVLLLVSASGAADWLLFAVGLLGLAGITALGGLRLLLPCAVVVGLFLLVLGPWPAEGGPDAGSMAGGALVSVCLLGLAWQAHIRARTLNAHRRRAVRESTRLKDHNARLALYLPDPLLPETRDAPAALQPPREVFVTVAFIDLVGFAELVAGHSVSEVVDVLNDFMAMISRLTSLHGGVLGKFLGDGVLIYFAPGTGGAQGAGPPRVRAAAGCVRLVLSLAPELLALSESWRARGLELQLRSRAGIASGYCALGDWGGRDRLDYTLIGTPVNLAGRLQALAEPGGALLSASAAALIGQDPDLAGRLGGERCLEIRGLGATMVHELSGSAKVRAIPLPVRTGKPDV